MVFSHQLLFVQIFLDKISLMTALQVITIIFNNEKTSFTYGTVPLSQVVAHKSVHL